MSFRHLQTRWTMSIVNCCYIKTKFFGRLVCIKRPWITWAPTRNKFVTNWLWKRREVCWFVFVFTWIRFELVKWIANWVSGCVCFSFHIQKLHCLSCLWWQQRHCLKEKLQIAICHISTVLDSTLQTNRKKNTDTARGIDLCACFLKLFSVELLSF